MSDIYPDRWDGAPDTTESVAPEPRLNAAQAQEAHLQAEADKLGITLEALKERILLVNNASNTFGQLALQLTNGDWDVALSIAGTFFASTLAQAAIHAGKSSKELWDFVVPSVETTSRILFDAFAEAEAIKQEHMQDVAAATTQGIAALDDTPKVG